MKSVKFRIPISFLFVAITVAACGGADGQGPSVEPPLVTSTGPSPKAALATYSDYYDETTLDRMAKASCTQLEQAVREAKTAIERNVKSISNHEGDESSLRAESRAARDLETSLDDRLFSIATAAGREEGVDELLPGPTRGPFTATILERCDLEDERQEVCDLVYLAVSKASDLVSDSTKSESDGKDRTDEVDGPSGWYPAGFREVGNGLAIKWLKPGEFECNILVDWCWGLKIIPRDACPNDLYVEVDIFDAQGSKVDTRYDSLGSLGAGEVGVLTFGTFESGAKTAQIGNTSCN